MRINREGYKISETERECTNCGAMFLKTSKTVTLCNKCNSERVKCTSPESKMFQRAKGRAKQKGLDFNLTVKDIIIPKHCPILGTELVCKSGASGGQKNSPALDRKDSKKGYTKDNIQVISHLANMMKSHATEEELISFANWIIKNIPKDSDQE
jgi:predicted  nucleic acid-binding Zn-ribbon protein